MTTESKSKLETILKNEPSGGGKPPPGQPDLRTTLERELEGEDSELAKELQRTRAEEIIARRRIAIERMRAGQVVQDTGGGKTPERGKEWLTDVAQGLLERGLDPSVVGRTIDYLLGVAQAPLVGLPGAPAPAQGMTFNDIKEIFKMGQEASKTDPTIAAILDKLTSKVQALEDRKPPEAPARKSYIFLKADGTVEEIAADRPLILEPKPASSEGKPLEEIKEENRHAEKMAELTTEKDYKTKVANTLAELPERIGRGIAGQIAEQGEEEKGGAAASSMEYLTCTNTEKGCNYSIPYPPDAIQIRCPKCGMVYKRETKA